MARTRSGSAVPAQATRGRLARAALAGASLPVCAAASLALGAAVPSLPAAAAVPPSPGSTSPRWCTLHGSSLVGWTRTLPDLPICGPGPAYGGTWDYVDLPGPGGSTAGYYSATPGFQCVELAERFLAVVYGLAPVRADGSTVAAHYHAAYAGTALYVNGSSSAVGHAPQPGDVLSLSGDSQFDGYDDGHVAVVVESDVGARTGDGTIAVVQENVASTDYTKTIDVVGWRLEDPEEPSDPEYQYPYAEWLHVAQIPSLAAAAAARARASQVLWLHERAAHAGPTGARLLAARASGSPGPGAFLRGDPLVVTAGLGLPVPASRARPQVRRA